RRRRSRRTSLSHPSCGALAHRALLGSGSYGTVAALSDLAVLRALRLAGVCDPPGLATRLALDEDAARRALDVVVQRGHAEERPRGFALTETGREALADALAEERATVPPDAARRLYDAFGNHDRRFKA